MKSIFRLPGASFFAALQAECKQIKNTLIKDLIQRYDLVPREALETQKKVLRKMQERLDVLEQKLEQQKQGHNSSMSD